MADSTSNIFSAPELIDNYVELGVRKAQRKTVHLLLLSLMAGVFIAFGGVVSNTVVHSIVNPGASRLISGIVWPIGLAIVMLLGGEIYLGNTMMVVSVLERRITLQAMLRNWILVYIGNFCGGLLVSTMIVFSGQLNLNSGALAAYTVKVAVGKVSVGFGQAVMSGILCNLLVCAAVLCSLTAKDTMGRIIGAYIPILYFIVGGFDNAVANMYLIPAGLLALTRPEYAALASAAGIDFSGLGWGSYLFANLLPVSIGNLIAGAGLASLLWFCHKKGKQ